MSTINAVKPATPVVSTTKPRAASVPASAPALPGDSLQLADGKPTLQQVLQLQNSADHHKLLGALGFAGGMGILLGGTLFGLAGPLLAIPGLVLGAAAMGFGIYHLHEESNLDDQIKLLKTQLPRQ
ncbi:MAG TPA: hypothetical protein V6D47_01525 [Oscillatoriaceae cyanobacterium]